MHVLRRAAARTILQQPLRQLSVSQPSCRLTTFNPTTVRSFHQSRRWLVEEEPKKAAAAPAASPAEAATSGETVTTEPSAPEQAVKAEVKADDAGKEQVAAQTSTSGPTSPPQAQAAQTSQPQSVPEQPSQSVDTAAARHARDVFDATSSTSSRPLAPRTATSSGPGRVNAPPSRILYVGNLFFEATAPQLEAEFARYGEITNSRVVTDSRGLSKGFGYIEFATQEAADRAVRELDQKVFQGRRMAVQYHVRREPRRPQSLRSREQNPPSKTLFIGNMSYQMSDRDLNELFRELRNHLAVRVAIDRQSGQPRGFAHVDFIDIPSAEQAKAHLEKKVIYGRQLRVDFSASSSTTGAA